MVLITYNGVYLFILALDYLCLYVLNSVNGLSVDSSFYPLKKDELLVDRKLCDEDIILCEIPRALLNPEVFVSLKFTRVFLVCEAYFFYV